MEFICILLFAMAVHGAQCLEVDVAKAFNDNEIVPDVLTVAPKKPLDVS